MADHQAATAARTTKGAQAAVGRPQGFGTFVSYRPTKGSMGDLGGQGSTQTLGSATTSRIWNNGSKTGPSIGSFAANALPSNADRPSADDAFLHPNSSASYEGKQGSSSLLPGSGEHESVWNRSKGWAGESTSPALANVSLNTQELTKSPARVRVGASKFESPKQQNDIPRSTSPFYGIPRQGAVGQHGGSLSQSPSTNNYLDPTVTTGFGEPLDTTFNARGRPLEMGAFHPQRFSAAGMAGAENDNSRQLSSILGANMEADDSALRRGRGLSNTRGLAPPGAEVLGAGIRSESLPPQHRATSSPPVYPNQSPPDGSFNAYTHLPTSNPGGLGQGFNVARETREAELLSKMTLGGDDEDTLNGARRSIQYGYTSQPPAFSVESYPYTRGNIPPPTHNISPWAPDENLYRQEGYGTEPYVDASYADNGFGVGDRLRPFDRNGAMSPPEQNGDYGRRNIGGNYYSAGGTPPSGLDSYRTPSRGGASRTPQSGNYGPQPEKLRQQLLVTQQQQQQQRTLPHPGQLMGGDQYRFAQYGGPTAYDYGPNGAMRVMPPYAGSISPLVPPTHPAGPRRNPEEYGSLRSPLLEEFRSNNKSSKRYELKDIYNHVVEFSGDQHGSRFIQQKLETANSDEKEIVFNEIKPNSLQLMTDVFGNYVIQKFFEHGNQVQKSILANQMQGHVLTLSLQMYGCRVVQKALEHVLTDQQAALVKELDSHVLKCVKDQNGNHVIQKAIERVPAQYIQFITSSFTGQIQSLATHPYGCRVIQRMLEHCDETSKAALLQELHSSIQNLVMDQYGNYVTQHVISQGQPEDRAKIVDVVVANIFQFSKHKFASNVVEKSIQFANDDQKRAIVKAVTELRPDGTSPLSLLMRDQFGNYVVQKLIQLLTGAEYDTLVEQIKPQIQALKKYAYGKQINAIEKLIYAGSAATSQPASPPSGPALATPPPLAVDASSAKSASPPSHASMSPTENKPAAPITPGDGAKTASS